MLTIIKKELRSYFNSPLAYVLLVVFLSLLNFFYFKNILLTGVANMRPMFVLLPWFLLFFVPALCMGLLSKEKESGTLEILVTQNIKYKNIILGKFFSALIFISIAILLTLIIPITLSGAGNFSLGILFSQYLGSIFLAAAFTALGLFASSLTKNSIISFILGIAFNFIFIIIGFEMVVLSLPARLGNFLNNLSILGHFNNIARGVLDIKDLLYFILLIIIFILFSLYIFNLKFKNNKNKKIFKNKLFIFIIFFIIIFLLTNLFNIFKFRIDLTENKIYSLSDSTKDILENNNNYKINLDLYISKKLPVQISSQAQDIKDLLSDYKKYNNINFNIYYPDSSEKMATQAQQAGIYPVQFNVVAKDEFQVKQGWLGLNISVYQDENLIDNKTISFIDNINNLEYQISSLIWQMINPDKKSILFLDNNLEINYLQQELSKQYNINFADENLNNLEENSVIIISENIDNNNLEKINNYLENNSALILGRQIAVDPQFLTTTSTESNLNKILNNYNLNLENNIIYDLQSHETVTLGQGSVSYILPYPFWINAINGQETILVPWANELTIFPPEADQSLAEDNIKINKLFTTTDSAGVQNLGEINLNPQQNFINNNLQTRLISASVEKDNSRIIVISNADFIADMFVQNFPQNLDFVLNSIEWLAQDEILSGIRNKNLSASPLIFKNNSNKNFIKYFNIAGVPVLIILFGIFWLNRRRKISKKKYKL